MSFEDLWIVPLSGALLGGVLGAILGSFLGAALVRLPAGRSLLFGRSRCDGCGKALAPGELVPVLSFVALRGSCRSCGRSIDPWHFAAEVGGALAGLWAAAIAADWQTFLLSFVLAMQLLLLGLLDLRHFWLPERLVLLLAVTGVAAAVVRFGWSPLLLSEALAGALLGFAVLWVPAALYRQTRGHEGMGGGDPRLLGALGLWLGPLGVVVTLLGASLAGLVAAAAMALSGRRVEGQTPLPLGSLLALAGWLAWLYLGRGQAWR